MHTRRILTMPARNTFVERAQRDKDFVREVLREAEALLLGGERDAADILLEDLALGAPRTEVTTRQIANLLCVSQSHVQQLIEQGHLESDADRSRLTLGDVIRYKGSARRSGWKPGA